MPSSTPSLSQNITASVGSMTFNPSGNVALTGKVTIDGNEIITKKSIENIIEEKLKLFYLETLGQKDEEIQKIKESHEQLKKEFDILETRFINLAQLSYSDQSILCNEVRRILDVIPKLQADSSNTITRETLEENMKLCVLDLMAEIQNLKDEIKILKK